jgi:tetratricopeptide (TPR) repeat protein
MTGRERLILLFALMLVLDATVVLAQLPQSSSERTPETSRIFTFYGDLLVFQLDGGTPPANLFFDLILYTGGNQAVARQRVAKGGRFRFNNIPEGNYLIAVEVNNVEIARVAMHVAHKKAEPFRQDIELEWTSALRDEADVSPAPSYARSNQNRALYERALKELNKNELAKSVATLRSLVEADPKDFPAWSDLAMVYFIERNFEAAANSYAKAIEVKPDYVTARVSLGRVRLAQKNNEAAIKVLEEALKVDPNWATTYYFLGEAYLALKKGSTAVEYLNQAIKLEPVAMAIAHLRLATLYHLAGARDLAATEYNEFLKKKPEYPDAQQLRDYIIANNPRTKRKSSPSPDPNP